MASGGDAELRRSRRADRRHASHPGRGEALGLRGPLPARAQLLHVAARPRGAAARNLHRLASASHLGRHSRRQPVHPARHDRDHGPELRLCRLRQGRPGHRVVLRPQGRRARDRPARGRADRQTGAQEPRHARDCGRVLRRHFLSACAVPSDRAGGRARGLRRRAARRGAVSSGRQPRRRRAGGRLRRRHGFG